MLCTLDIFLQDSSDEDPTGEDARSCQAHQEILKGVATSQQSTRNDEAIALSMEATRKMQKKLMEKSVHELLDNFPIYKMDEMVSCHLDIVGICNNENGLRG